MTYETIDWEAEALQVARAFDVLGACEFVRTAFSTSMELRSKETGVEIQIAKRLFLMASYSDYARQYVLWEGWSGRRGRQTEINVKWNNRALIPHNDPKNRLRLARAMFHLDLLNAETETAIDASISAHQKLEWTLEYQQKYLDL